MKNSRNKKIDIFIFYSIFFLLVIFSSQLFSVMLSPLSVALSNIEDKQIPNISTEKNTHSQHANNYRYKKSFNGKQRLTNTANSNPWSNAFNFDKTWNTQTDPRTGVLTAFIKIGSMISNLGHGPDINLKISYNSGSHANPDSLGTGWSWNLTHFNLHVNQLTMSTGQNLYLQKMDNQKWKLLYHKLKDIDIRGNQYSELMITYANGLREILNNKGYEIRLERQDGNAVNFFYAPGTHLLTNITDNQNHQIKIIYHENYIIVISQGAMGQPVKVRINRSNDQLKSVVLPVQNHINGSSIQIRYKGNLITELDYPTGLRKIFYYNCTSAIRMITTVRQAILSLCAVSNETTVTNITQSPLVIHYGYSEINANNHNYLGFNAGHSFSTDYSVRDLLFEVPADYTYRTLEDNQRITEIRTYNKYHLLINDKKISDRTGRTLSETDTFYCRTDRRNGCAHTSFEELPVTYSLPLKVVTKIWGDIDGKPDINIVINSYDELGRMIYSKDNYGRVTKVMYCPVKGDIACPAIPEEWAANTLPESFTIYPSKKIISAVMLPVTTYNYYRRELNRSGTGYILMLDHQVHQSGRAKVVVKRYYYDDPHNRLTYGLLRKTIFKKEYNNLSPVSARIRHYYYTSDDYSKTMYSTVELGDNRFQRFPAITTSLFTNQLIQQANIDGTNINLYHYDNYGRLIRKDIAVHTPFAAYIHYQYIVSPVLNQILVTSANGLQEKIIFDSSGRKLQQWDEMVSVTGRAAPGKWLLKKQFTYDRYGHLIKVYHYAINSQGKKDKLIVTYNYDDMDAVTRIVLPDGQQLFKLYNDPEQCTINYRMSNHNQRSAITIVHHNELDKPVQSITLPAFQGSLSAVKKLCYRNEWQQDARISKMTYDGFGRNISSTDPAGRTRTKIYNSLGEITITKDNSGNEMHYAYDFTGHLISAYKQYKGFAGFGVWLMYSAQYNPAGQLIWKINSSQQKTTYTYTADGHPATIITPGGHIISFSYNLSGLLIARYIDGKLQLRNAYDPVTLLLIKKEDSTGTTQYIYADDGELQQEIHTGKYGYPDYKLQWFYDLNRRLTAQTDINGNKTSTQYDQLGRVTALYYHTLQGHRQLLAKLAYDDFARTAAIYYGSGMQRNIDYDGYGRRYQVKDILNKQLLFQWNYTYDVINNIIQLKQQGQDNQTGLLNYRYDIQNNLISMTCNGSSGLPLCPRDTAFSGSGLNDAPVIIRQDYHFNPLNRMIKLTEVLQNSLATTTLNKVVSYHYYNKMPLRLQSINMRWNNNAPVDRDFNYDMAGNMITDGEGNKITYNSLNQIASVITAAGEHSYYRYNGSGKEVMEKTPFSIHHLFYHGHNLINESIYTHQNQTMHIVGYQNIVRIMDGVIDQYYEKNYKGDITGVLTRNPSNGQFELSQSNVYSPYGMCWHYPKSATPFYQQLLTGFNSERTDPITHWQFLGAGQRTYNPQQHYFVSEDPAGDGYAFAANNPIMKIDPDGNTSRPMGKALRITNYITTLGLSATHKQWAAIVGTLILGTAFVISTAVAVLSVTGDFLVAVVGYTFNSGLGIVPFLAELEPASREMDVAGVVIGSIALVTTIAVGTSIVGRAIFNGVKAITNTLSAFGAAEVSENITSQVEAIPMRVLRSAEMQADLGKDLLRFDPELMITRENEASYLTLQSDKQVDDAVVALRYARGKMDNSIAAALTASKLSGKPLNLNSIDEYLAAIETDKRSSELFSPYISDIKKEAMNQLFKPFGEFETDDYSLLSAQLSVDPTVGYFIVRHRTVGTFVIYFDENNANLMIARYSYARSLMERFHADTKTPYYQVYEYIVF